MGSLECSSGLAYCADSNNVTADGWLLSINANALYVNTECLGSPNNRMLYYLAFKFHQCYVEFYFPSQASVYKSTVLII